MPGWLLWALSIVGAAAIVIQILRFAELCYDALDGWRMYRNVQRIREIGREYGDVVGGDE